MNNVHLRILIQAVPNKPESARFPATITGGSSNAISITYIIGVARAFQYATISWLLEAQHTGSLCVSFGKCEARTNDYRDINMALTC